SMWRRNSPASMSLFRRACQIRHCRRSGARSQLHKGTAGIASLRFVPQQATGARRRITGSKASIVALMPEKRRPNEGAMIWAAASGEDEVSMAHPCRAKLTGVDLLSHRDAGNN